MQVEETPPKHTLFITSVSVNKNKWILSARFRNHIVETDKTIYKVSKKNTNEVFEKRFRKNTNEMSSLTPSAKDHAFALFETPPSILTTKSSWYLRYLLHIYNIFVTCLF